MNAASFKTFAITVLKLACGIVLATLILGLVGWGIITSRDKSEQAAREAANAPLAKLKTWPEIRYSALGDAKVNLKTVWRNGQVHYQLDVDGYPIMFRQAESNPTAIFVINFLDKDGFQLFEHRVKLESLSKVIGNDNQPIGLSWKGFEYLSASVYSEASKVNLGWAGFQSTPNKLPSNSSASGPKKPAEESNPLDQSPEPVMVIRKRLIPPPPWRDPSHWRMLRNGIRQADVRNLLGEPEKVINIGGLVTWYYGYPSGGHVSFEGDGTVHSWSEP